MPAIPFSEVLILRFVFQPVVTQIPIVLQLISITNPSMVQKHCSVSGVCLFPSSFPCIVSVPPFLLLVICQMFLLNHSQAAPMYLFVSSVSPTKAERTRRCKRIFQTSESRSECSAQPLCSLSAVWLPHEFIRAFPHSWSSLRKIQALMPEDSPQQTTLQSPGVAFLRFSLYHTNPRH